MKNTDWATVRLGIEAFVAQYSGLAAGKVIWRDQPGTRPAPDFISMKFIVGPVKMGSFDDIRLINGTYYLCGLRKFTLSIQAFGSTSFSAIMNLMDSLENPDAISTLAGLGVSIANNPGITDISLALETAPEKRYSMDLILQVGQNVELTSVSIKNIEIEGTMDKNLTHEQEIDVITNNV